MFIATGTYRIERGSGVDSFGDTVDVPAQQWDGVPLALTEEERRAGGSSNFVRERVVIGRGRAGLDVREYDRVTCEQNGERFVVTTTHRPNGINIFAGDTLFELSRTAVDAP